MEMIKSVHFFIAVCATFFIVGCANKQECTPDHSDDVWKSVGEGAPAISQIKAQLVGKDESFASDMLHGGAIFETDKNGSFERTWVFEKRARSLLRDCINPDRVDVSQSFLIVRAVLSDGVITECTVQNRMLVSKSPVSIEAMLALPKSPLDSDLESCGKGMKNRDQSTFSDPEQVDVR